MRRAGPPQASNRAPNGGSEGAWGEHASGALVAANRLAAEAGAELLRRGGNAADAALAAAAALCVVDPANRGIGGYGGFAVVHTAAGAVSQIGFNAAVPRCAKDGRIAPGGAGTRVTPPAVAAGLCALGRAFGRLGVASALAPAIELAREGFRVGSGLTTALARALTTHRGLNDAFRRMFAPKGAPLREGDRLVQPALARTLTAIADGQSPGLADDRITHSLLCTVNAAGGALVADDFAAPHATVCDAVTARYRDCDVFVPDPDACGSCIVLDALRSLDGADLGDNRRDRYVDALGAALRDAWRRRDAAYSPLSRATGQTTHLCVADGDGMLVSLTFTHGPVWFGSGLLDEETGILLNCGMHILARRNDDGRVVAQPHLAPTIVRHRDARYALGSPGGRRIPAIVLQAIVDLVDYDVPIERLLDALRLSANADGALDAEAELAARMPERAIRIVEPSDYFGPAGAVQWTARGTRSARDPRFADACAIAA